MTPAPGTGLRNQYWMARPQHGNFRVHAPFPSDNFSPAKEIFPLPPKNLFSGRSTRGIRKKLLKSKILVQN